MRFIENIDWKLLNKQKQELMMIIVEDTITFEKAEAIEGILCLLDNIQDYALYDLGKKEEEIY